MELVIKEDASEKWPKESIYHGGGESEVSKPVDDGRFRRGEELNIGASSSSKTNETDEHLIENVSDGVGEREEPIDEVAERIGDAVKGAIKSDESSGVEAMKAEGVEIEEAPGFWVGGDEDLKPSIKQEAMEMISSNSSADAIGGFH